MAEREWEEWCGDPPPHLPGEYIKDQAERGFHYPGDHLKNFDPLKSTYDREILSLLGISFLAGLALALAVDRYWQKHQKNYEG